MRHIANILRLTTFVIIIALLFNPTLRRQTTTEERPVVVLGQDNSQSVVLTADSSYYRGEYAERIERLVDQLSDDYQVECYTIGSALGNSATPDYSEHSTNLNSALTEIENATFGRNLGAIILATDGIHNSGISPVGHTMSVPLYTIALGDTTPRCDAAVAHVRHNTIAYIGNTTPIEITLQATNLDGSRHQLSVAEGHRVVHTQPVAVAGSHYTATVPLELTMPQKAGIYTYTVSLTAAAGESTTSNNSQSFSVQVIDSHQQIALLAAAPHPDVAALRRSIERNQNYEVAVFVGSQINDCRLQDYDLVILHNLPSATQSVDVQRLPALFVVGSGTSLDRLNQLNRGITISAKTTATAQATVQANASFACFTLTQGTIKTIESLPPLATPFGQYTAAANTHTLLTANIGGIATTQPVAAYNSTQGLRTAYLLGEGLWRWSLYDYQLAASHDAIDELLWKSITYTAQQVGKQRFVVDAPSVYASGEPLTLSAHLYDDNYQPTNTPEATIAVDGVSYTFNRCERDNSYTITLPQPAGEGQNATTHHSYTATTTLAGHRYSATGAFVVDHANLEQATLQANHALLNTIAATSGGTMLYPSQLDELPAILAAQGNLKPLLHTHYAYMPLNASPIVLIIIVVLLTAEWVIRKML